MEKRLNNRFNMYNVVKAWLVNHQSQLEHLPSFTKVVSDFTKLLDDIAELNTKQTASTDAAATAKTITKNELAKQTLETIKILKAYAAFEGKDELLSDIDSSPSSITRAADQMLLTKSKRALYFAEREQASAETYGLSAKRVSLLKKALSDFENKQTAIRSAIVERKDAGEQLNAQMEDADDLLKSKIDILMGLASITLPELYNQYKGARIIVDR